MSLRRFATPAAAVVFAGYAVFVLGTSARQRLIDLTVYRFGGHSLGHGLSLYPTQAPGTELLFTYPPFAAVVFAPLALVPLVAAKIIVTGLSLAALLAVVRMLTRRVLATQAWWPALLIAIPVGFSEPVRETLRLGQVNLWLAVLVLADVWLLGARHSRWAGVLIGLAAGLKLTPAAAGLYLLGFRRWRAAVCAAAGFVVTVAIGFAASPDSSLRYWFDGLLWDAARIGGADYISNQSLTGLVIRWGGSMDAGSLARPGLSLLALAAGLLAAARFARRPGGEVAALAAVVLAGLLASPISWTHHWVLWPVVAAALVATPGCWQRWRNGLAGAFTAVLLAGVIWTVPHYADRELHLSWWQLLVGDAYGELAVLALVTLTVVAMRPVPIERLPPRWCTVPRPGRLTGSTT